MWLGLLLTVGLLLAGCGGKNPAEPGPDPVAVDWDALAVLFDDPLFQSLPLRLHDQAAAQPLVSVESELVDGIRARDLEVVLRALMRVGLERERYADCPCSIPGDTPELVAISLFEMRGHGYLAHVIASEAPAATAAEAAR